MEGMWEPGIDDENEKSTIRPIKNDEGAIRIAEAIVRGVTEEYRAAYLSYLESESDEELRKSQAELMAKEALIRSKYFSTLTMSQLTPDAVIASLRMQVEKELKRR